MSEALNLNDANFDEVIANNSFVVVDFWASWCRPCMMMAPTIDILANEHTNITFAKVDVDAYPDIAGKFKVRSIPCFILFKNGNHVGEIIGSMPKEKFIEKLREYI